MITVWLPQVWYWLAGKQTWSFHNSSICPQMHPQKTSPAANFSGTTQFMAMVLTKLEWEDLHLMTIASKWLLGLPLDSSLKRTNDIRQLCVDRWYMVAKSKWSFVLLNFFPILTKSFSHFHQIGWRTMAKCLLVQWSWIIIKNICVWVFWLTIGRP